MPNQRPMSGDPPPSPALREPFAALGAHAADLERAWAAAGHAERAFPALAAERLGAIEMDFDMLVAGMCSNVGLPAQRPSSFGQPGVTLYHGGNFVIEALCWHTGSPGIHQHAFSGAFRVVTGRSLHTRYTFDPATRPDRRIQLGTLEVAAVEILDSAQVVEIPRGAALVHSAFHLDNPSMTLIARTLGTADPEYAYLPPGLAFDPGARSAALAKQLQLLDTVARARPTQYLASNRAALASADMYGAFLIAARAARTLGRSPELAALLDELRTRFGACGDVLTAAIREDQRRTALVDQRQTIVDEDHRFFVGALLSFSDRAQLVDGMIRYHGDPGRAQQAIASGIRELLGIAEAGGPLVEALVRAVLAGVAGDAFPDFAAALLGHTASEAERRELQALYHRLGEHPLLRPLYR